MLTSGEALSDASPSYPAYKTRPRLVLDYNRTSTTLSHLLDTLQFPPSFFAFQPPNPSYFNQYAPKIAENCFRCVCYY